MDSQYNAIEDQIAKFLYILNGQISTPSQSFFFLSIY